MSRKQMHKVELTDDQRNELGRIVASPSKKLSHETKVRAKALLYLDEVGDNPLSPADTAKKCKLHKRNCLWHQKTVCRRGLRSHCLSQGM